MRRFGTGEPQDGETAQAGSHASDSKAGERMRAARVNVYKMCRSFRKQRGAAAVEFAVIAPVFVLLLFGMIEYGRMVMVQQMLTNATREGARRAVLDGVTATEVRNTVKDYLTGGGIAVNDNEITVNPDPATAAFGDPVTVSLSIPFSRVSWLPAPMYLGTTNMSASSVMKRESVQ